MNNPVHFKIIYKNTILTETTISYKYVKITHIVAKDVKWYSKRENTLFKCGFAVLLHI